MRIRTIAGIAVAGAAAAGAIAIGSAAYGADDTGSAPTYRIVQDEDCPERGGGSPAPDSTAPAETL